MNFSSWLTRPPRQVQAISPPDRLTPPRVGWLDWYAHERVTYKQGMHVLICGPTGSGKTVLCRHVVRLRQYVVVLGTKPSDDSLDAYVDEGYLRIDHWPPTKADMREFDGLKEARFLVWPAMRRREELRQHRDLFLKVLDEVYYEGGWTLVIDESLWFTNPKGLDLGNELSDLAYGSRSNNVSLGLLSQRAIIPGYPIIWMNVSQVLGFNQGRVDDIKELASLGTYRPQDVAAAIDGLRGYQFLDLPVRAQADWAVSQVPKSWA